MKLSSLFLKLSNIRIAVKNAISVSTAKRSIALENKNNLFENPSLDPKNLFKAPVKYDKVETRLLKAISTVNVIFEKSDSVFPLIFLITFKRSSVVNLPSSANFLKAPADIPNPR